jgi:hypothetical protein
MTKDEALKKIKPTENYLTLECNYSKLVLTYKDAIAVLAALANAEVIESDYSDDKVKIVPVVKTTYTVTPLSAEKYKDIKVAQLLGVTYEQLKNTTDTDATGST